MPQAQSREPRDALLSYGGAIVVMTMVALLHFALRGVLADRYPFLAFFFGVLIAAWWGGYGPGLLAVVVGGLAAIWLATPPGRGLPAEARAELVPLFGYVVVASTIALLTAGQQAARRRAETSARQMRRSEERYRRLVELSPDALCVNLGGRIVYANPASLRLFGATRPEQIVGRTALDLVHPDSRPLVEARMRQVLEESRAVPTVEAKGLRLDGAPFDVEATAIPVPWESGTGIQVILRDIGERKLVQSEIRRLHETLENRVALRTAQLEQANAELSAFAYTIAHDLRAPLRAMHGFAQALVEDYGGQFDAAGREYASRIVAAAERLDLLIQDLLTYSRLSRDEVQLGPVDLNPVVDEALSHFAADVVERGAEIEVERPLATVVGQRSTLHQVISNLLSNALKFVRAGVAPRVRVWSQVNSSHVRLWVEDNGIGIAPEHQERIFRVFERLRGIEAYPGTGIGLAIVRKGAERLGGRSGVESEVENGSRFWIELPRGTPLDGS